MRSDRVCVWVRLLFAALTFYGLSIADRYVRQQQLSVIGARPGWALAFDSLHGEIGWLYVPEVPSPDEPMVLPPDTAL